MHDYAIAVPLPDGGAKRLDDFTAELLGPRRAQHDINHTEQGFRQEMGFVQGTPMGDMFLLYIRSDDALAAGARLGASQHPHDVWCKSSLATVFGPGVDFSQGLPPISQLLFDYRDNPDTTGMTGLAIALPLPPGRSDHLEAFLRRFSDEALVTRRTDHDATRRQHGLNAELAWIQRTPQGDAFILYLEGVDPAAANAAQSRGDTEYDRWFQSQLAVGFAGLADFSKPIPPMSHLAYDWRTPAAVAAAS